MSSLTADEFREIQRQVTEIAAALQSSQDKLDEVVEQITVLQLRLLSIRERLH